MTQCLRANNPFIHLFSIFFAHHYVPGVQGERKGVMSRNVPPREERVGLMVGKQWHPDSGAAGPSPKAGTLDEKAAVRAALS